MQEQLFVLWNTLKNTEPNLAYGNFTRCFCFLCSYSTCKAHSPLRRFPALKEYLGVIKLPLEIISLNSSLLRIVRTLSNIGSALKAFPAIAALNVNCLESSISATNSRAKSCMSIQNRLSY